jgi:hypothetical protein
VLITNPHNPLGFCYSREVLLAYCRLAQRWNLFLVSDFLTSSDRMLVNGGASGMSADNERIETERFEGMYRYEQGLWRERIPRRRHGLSTQRQALVGHRFQSE